MDESRPPIPLSILLLFLAVMAAFVLTALFVVTPSLMDSLPDAFLWAAGALGLLGLLLVVSSVRAPMPAGLKRTLLLTGGSAAGAVAGMVLHNLLYAFGTTVESATWFARILSVLEAAFFLLATVVFPATFIIGSAAAVVLLIRSRSTPHSPSTGGLNAAH